MWRIIRSTFVVLFLIFTISSCMFSKKLTRRNGFATVKVKLQNPKCIAYRSGLAINMPIEKDDQKDSVIIFNIYSTQADKFEKAAQAEKLKGAELRKQHPIKERRLKFKLFPGMSDKYTKLIARKIAVKSVLISALLLLVAILVFVFVEHGLGVLIGVFALLILIGQALSGMPKPTKSKKDAASKFIVWVSLLFAVMSILAILLLKVIPLAYLAFLIALPVTVLLSLVAMKLNPQNKVAIAMFYISLTCVVLIAILLFARGGH